MRYPLTFYFLIAYVFSWRCLDIPGRDNVLRAFCFLYEVEPNVRVMLLAEPGFANQFGMNS